MRRALKGLMALMRRNGNGLTECNAAPACFATCSCAGGGCLNTLQQLPLRMRSGILTEAAPAADTTPIVAQPVGLTALNGI